MDWLVSRMCKELSKLSKKETYNPILKNGQFEQILHQRRYKDGKYTCEKICNIISYREMQIDTQSNTTVHLLK